MKKITYDCSKIDWELLREQKNELFEVITSSKSSIRTKLLEGILHLIDDIQDHVVDSGQLEESEVFNVGIGSLEE